MSYCFWVTVVRGGYNVTWGNTTHQLATWSHRTQHIRSVFNTIILWWSDEDPGISPWPWEKLAAGCMSHGLCPTPAGVDFTFINIFNMSTRTWRSVEPTPPDRPLERGGTVSGSYGNKTTQVKSWSGWVDDFPCRHSRPRCCCAVPFDRPINAAIGPTSRELITLILFSCCATANTWAQV